MKKEILTVLLLFVVCATFAFEIEQEYNRMGCGLAKGLNTDVQVLVMYVCGSDDVYPQSLKDKDLKNLKAAEEWLKSEARRYGKTISFGNYLANWKDGTTVYYQNKSFWNEYGNVNDAITVNNILNDWLSDIPGITKYDLLRRRCDNSDNLVVVVFTPYYFSSKSNANRKNTYSIYMEGVLIGRQTYSGYMQAEIAHEMLHLLGATDLYTTDRFYGPWESYTSSFDYNRSIMRIVDKKSIYDLRIDEITAYLVGLTRYSKEWYRYFCENN